MNTMKTRMMNVTLFVLLSLALLVSGGKAANAQVSFLIQPVNLAGKPGDLLSFTGILTNLGTDEVFLNSDLFSLNGVGLTLDDSPFFTNFPLSLTGGQTFSGEIFTVELDPTVGPGIYNGSFTIQGGPTDSSFNNLGTQNFNIVVGAPEPASGLLLLFSGAMGATAYLRRRSLTKTS